MIYEITDTKIAAPLFDGWQETLIWSCLQGIMGKIYADDFVRPRSALAVLGDFAFFAGEAEPEFLNRKPDWSNQDFIIMVPQNDAWKNAIAGYYGQHAQVITRFATKKEPNVFDRKMLSKAAASLPAGYELRLIDEQLYDLCKSEPWSRDLVSQFGDYEEYRRLGLGVVVQKDKEILSGASSYSRYREGIEIEIDTRESFRRQGLAFACGAGLILEALNRSLYPSWDAHNRGSLALAEKLGYHFSHEYVAIEVRTE